MDLLPADDVIKIMSSGTTDIIMILNVVISLVAAWRSHSAAKTSVDAAKRLDTNTGILQTISANTNGTLSDLMKQRDEANRQIAALISRNRGADQ